MKNFLIILGILAVTYLAYTDTMKRFRELDSIAATTPSQEEMKSTLLQTQGRGIKDKNIDKRDRNTNRTRQPITREMKGGQPQDLRQESQIPNSISP